jgi:spore coat polysaccharide biosynthesis protein SpsF (cytidylyltransferase family)
MKNQQRTVAIVQARIGSDRLPGKVMMEIEGKPLIWHVMNRLSFVEAIDVSVLATTLREEDDGLVTMADEYGWARYRGDNEDVLARYFGAAGAYHAKTIIRITGDCALIDPELVKLALDAKETKEVDFVTAAEPAGWPDGFDVEVFSYSALSRAWYNGQARGYREHVTEYMYCAKDITKHVMLMAQPARFLKSQDFGFSVNTEEDLERVRAIYQYVGRPVFGMEDVVKYVEGI